MNDQLAGTLAKVRTAIEETLSNPLDDRAATIRALDLYVANGILLSYDLSAWPVVRTKMTERYARQVGDALVAEGLISGYAYVDGGLSVQTVQPLESVTLTLNVEGEEDFDAEWRVIEPGEFHEIARQSNEEE